MLNEKTLATRWTVPLPMLTLFAICDDIVCVVKGIKINAFAECSVRTVYSRFFLFPFLFLPFFEKDPVKLLTGAEGVLYHMMFVSSRSDVSVLPSLPSLLLYSPWALEKGKDKERREPSTVLFPDSIVYMVQRCNDAQLVDKREALGVGRYYCY